MQDRHRFLTMAGGGLLVLAAPGLAQAYLGPGLGLGAIGAALGAVAAVFLGLLSIAWYPFKRLWRRLRGNRRPGAKSAARDQDG